MPLGVLHLFCLGALAGLIEKCVEGANVYTLCRETDNFMDDAMKKCFNKAKVSKGTLHTFCSRRLYSINL
jgi:hypothetical protein